MVQPMARPIYQPVRRMPMAVPMARPVYVPVFRPPMMPRLNIAPKQSYRNPSGQGMIFGDRLPGAGPVAPRRSFVPSVGPMASAAPMVPRMSPLSPSATPMSRPMYVPVRSPVRRRFKRSNSEGDDKKNDEKNRMTYMNPFFAPMPRFMPPMFRPPMMPRLNIAPKQSYRNPSGQGMIFGDRLPGAGPVAPRRSFVPSVGPMASAAPMVS